MSACPDDGQLLALVAGQLGTDELASMDIHLESCVVCREVVATLASRGDERDARGRESRPDAALAKGARVGRFVIESLAGRGATGVVYVARDPELERRVALKLLSPGARDPELLRARTLREAQAMARLSHPHVVTVFEVGRLDEAVFVAMELVDGTSLRELLAREHGTLSSEAVLALYRQAGEGLAAAHAAGLVHRDFKPDNVVVDGLARVKVTDFGLARVVTDAARVPGDMSQAEQAVLEPVLTEQGALLGTPAYMSPEQLRAEEADARSDQFSFCVSLWEALAGKRPFEGSTIRALQTAIARGPTGDLPGGVARRVVRALRRGLSPRPDERFDSMNALLEELAPVSRRKWVVALGTAGLCAAAFALAFSGARRTEDDVCSPSKDAIDASWNDERRAEVLAAFARGEPARGGADGRSVVQALDRWADAHSLARYDACTATHLRHEQSAQRLDERVACLDSGRLALEALVAELAKGDRHTLALAPEALAQLPVIAECADTRLARSTGVTPPDAAVAQQVDAMEREMARARVLIATAQLAPARKLAEAIAEGARATGYLPLVARAELLRADALRGTAEYAGAEVAARAALLAAETSRDETTIVRAWLALTAIEGELGRYAVAAEHARHADAVIARLDRPDTLEILVRNASGVVHYNLGQHEAARRDLESALALARRVHGDDGAQVAKILTNLGNLARAAGKLDEALELHRRAMALDSARHGAEHPLLGRHHHNIAGVLRLTSTPDDALPEYLRALAIKEASLGEHPDVALTENSLGLYHAARDQPQEAARHYERALAIYERHGHGQRAMVLYNLGLLDLQSAHSERALARFRAARAIDETRLGPRSAQLAAEWSGEANALRALGRVQESEQAQASADAIRRDEGPGTGLAPAVQPAVRAMPAPRPAPSAAPRPPGTGKAPAPPPPARSAPTGEYGAGQAWD